MFKGKESVRMIHKQSIGFARQQNKGMPMPNMRWEGCMIKGKESVRMIHKQCSGFARQQNKGMPMPKIVWV